MINAQTINLCLTNRKMNFFFKVVLALCLSLACVPGSVSWAADSPTVDATQAEKLTVTVGKSVVIDSRTPVKRVSLAAPDVADALVLSPRQIYITGKNSGITTLTLWSDPDKISRIFDVEVQPDIARLKAKLHELLPGEKDVRVTTSNGGIILSGSISSTGNLSQVQAITQAFAPPDKDGKPRITNLLEVGGVQQVMLEVRVSEMSRSLGRQLGINFANLSASGRQFGVSRLDSLTGLSSTEPSISSAATAATVGSPARFSPDAIPLSFDPVTGAATSYATGPSITSYAVPATAAAAASYALPLTASTSINAILRFLAGGATWTTFIDALKESGLIKVLAEPSLITLSGRQASFLAGGEYPIPVPQASAGGTTITIEYKPFGVALNFTPSVLSSGKISMLVAPEVSDLDFSRAIALQGYIIPSLTTRRVSTTVELADGQSFAIAGLLRDDVREIVRKFPVLGDIPVLGALFRSTNFQRNETELIIIVTPHLVKPVDMTKQTLPTDAFVVPNDFEWYLLGTMEGEKPNPTPSSSSIPPASLSRRGGLEGNFGHIMP
jgi:pilus assembly protein CpaC